MVTAAAETFKFLIGALVLLLTANPKLEGSPTGQGVARCTTVTVDAPGSSVIAGNPLQIAATVTGGAPAVKPTYAWTISKGTIVSGQGESSISVDTNE